MKALWYYCRNSKKVVERTQTSQRSSSSQAQTQNVIVSTVLQRKKGPCCLVSEYETGTAGWRELPNDKTTKISDTSATELFNGITVLFHSILFILWDHPF